MTFLANLLIGIKKPKTKDNYKQEQQKNLNNRATKLLTYAQTKANHTKAWFMDGPFYDIRPANG